MGKHIHRTMRVFIYIQMIYVIGGSGLRIYVALEQFNIYMYT